MFVAPLPSLIGKAKLILSTYRLLNKRIHVLSYSPLQGLRLSILMSGYTTLSAQGNSYRNRLLPHKHGATKILFLLARSCKAGKRMTCLSHICLFPIFPHGRQTQADILPYSEGTWSFSGTLFAKTFPELLFRQMLSLLPSSLTSLSVPPWRGCYFPFLLYSS